MTSQKWKEHIDVEVSIAQPEELMKEENCG